MALANYRQPGVSIEYRPLSFVDPDKNILEHIQQELNRSLGGFIGEVNNEETLERMKYTSQAVLMSHDTAGVLTPEILERGIQIAQDNHGSPTHVNINPEVFSALQNKPKKYSKETELKDKISHLLDVKDSLQNKIKELEDQVEYYKMLALEN